MSDEDIQPPALPQSTTPDSAQMTAGELRSNFKTMMSWQADQFNSVNHRLKPLEDDVLNLKTQAWGGPNPPSVSQKPPSMIVQADRIARVEGKLDTLITKTDSQSTSMGVGLSVIKWLFGSRDGRVAIAAMVAAAGSLYTAVRSHQPAQVVAADAARVVYVMASNMPPPTPPPASNSAPIPTVIP